LLFFGVFVDMIHIVLLDHAWTAVLGTVEDGGEMLAVSIAVWLTYASAVTLMHAKPQIRGVNRPDGS
jgi:hypothetical protein